MRLCPFYWYSIDTSIPPAQHPCAQAWDIGSNLPASNIHPIEYSYFIVTTTVRPINHEMIHAQPFTVNWQTTQYSQFTPFGENRPLHGPPRGVWARSLFWNHILMYYWEWEAWNKDGTTRGKQGSAANAGRVRWFAAKFLHLGEISSCWKGYLAHIPPPLPSLLMYSSTSLGIIVPKESRYPRFIAVFLVAWQPVLLWSF